MCTQRELQRRSLLNIPRYKTKTKGKSKQENLCMKSNS